MCWNLQVSFAVAAYGLGVSAYLYQRKYSYRDEWYGMFLASLTLTQLLDSFFWWYKGEREQLPCDSMNFWFSKVVVSVVVFSQVVVITHFPSSRFRGLRKYYRILPGIGALVSCIWGRCTLCWVTKVTGGGLFKLPTLIYWGIHTFEGNPGVPPPVLLFGVALWSLAALLFITPWWAAANVLLVGGLNLLVLLLVDGAITLVSKFCFCCLLLSLLWLSEPLWAPRDGDSSTFVILAPAAPGADPGIFYELIQPEWEVLRPQEPGAPGTGLLMLVSLCLVAMFQGPQVGTYAQVVALLLTASLWGLVVFALTLTPEKQEEEQAARLAKALANPGTTGLTLSWYDQTKESLSHVGASLVATAIVLLVACVTGHTGQWLSEIWLGLRGTLSERQLFLGGIFGTHVLTFWGIGLPFAALDMARPGHWAPYKCQEDSAAETWGRLRESARVALRNQALSLVVLYAAWLAYPAAAPHGFAEDLPPLSLAAVQLVAAACYGEIVSYGVHRALHTAWLWKHVHSIHHSWTAPTAISSIYAHPLEHVFGNTLALLVGPLVMGCHVSLWYCWAFVATAACSLAHCGWHLPFLPSPESHDYHHAQGFDNIGLFSGLLDSALGTNSAWLKAWQQRHDRVYTSPDYPVDKILARQGHAAAPRVDFRPIPWQPVLDLAEQLAHCSGPDMARRLAHATGASRAPEAPDRQEGARGADAPQAAAKRLDDQAAQAAACFDEEQVSECGRSDCSDTRLQRRIEQDWLIVYE